MAGRTGWHRAHRCSGGLTFAVENFWDFSVRTYRTPGVPDACLSMQNDYGADVNMLLYCCWVGAVVGEFDDDLFERSSEYSRQWAGNVVQPLRQARTWMKHIGCSTAPTPTDDCMQLREEVKIVEFAAEKMQQEVLESMTAVDQCSNRSIGQVIADVAANLKIYLEWMHIEPAIDVQKKLTDIGCAAFPTADENIIADALKG